jgi:hypothetical protein
MTKKQLIAMHQKLERRINRAFSSAMIPWGELLKLKRDLTIALQNDLKKLEVQGNGK